MLTTRSQKSKLSLSAFIMVTLALLLGVSAVYAYAEEQAALPVEQNTSQEGLSEDSLSADYVAQDDDVAPLADIAGDYIEQDEDGQAEPDGGKKPSASGLEELVESALSGQQDIEDEEADTSMSEDEVLVAQSTDGQQEQLLYAVDWARIWDGGWDGKTRSIVQGGGFQICTLWCPTFNLNAVTVHAKPLSGGDNFAQSSGDWFDVEYTRVGFGSGYTYEVREPGGDFEWPDDDHRYFLVELHLPWNARTGTWIVDSIMATDTQGNTYAYTAEAAGGGYRYVLNGEDAGISAPLFEVYQSQEDEVAPIIKSVSIGNPNSTVQRPGILKLDIDTIEEGTGISSVYIYASLVGGNSSFSYDYIDGDTYYDESGNRKVLNIRYGGKQRLYVPVPADAYTGTWEYVLRVRDRSGNESSYRTLDYTGSTNGGSISTQCSNSDGAFPCVIVPPQFNVIDEFNYAFTLGIDNPLLTSRISSMPDGSYARVKIDGGGKLPAAAFDAIRGTKKAILCYSSKGYQWIFRGEDIVNKSKDANLSLSVASVPKEDIGTDKDGVELVFAQNGELPGKAEVRFKSDYLFTFRRVLSSLKLFYDKGSAYEQEATDFDLAFDGSDKWCYVTISHNSRFVIAGQKIEKIAKLGSKAKVSGQTYKVTKRASAKKPGTVTLIRAKNARSVVVPATIKMPDHKTYEVTRIAAKAFTGKKTRIVTVGKNVLKIDKSAFSSSRATKVIIKTKGLKATTVKGCFKGSKVTTVQVKVGTKAANKKTRGSYKKVFTKGNTQAKKLVLK